jgi:MFS family permease
MIESFAKTSSEWAGAKLLAGVGVGCIQATLPVYITEWSPNNIRGAMILCYSILNGVGTFCAPLALTVMQKRDPLDYKVPILTQ